MGFSCSKMEHGDVQGNNPDTTLVTCKIGYMTTRSGCKKIELGKEVCGIGTEWKNNKCEISTKLTDHMTDLTCVTYDKGGGFGGGYMAWQKAPTAANACTRTGGYVQKIVL